jgi:hypothetical protein
MSRCMQMPFEPIVQRHLDKTRWSAWASRIGRREHGDGYI